MFFRILPVHLLGFHFGTGQRLIPTLERLRPDHIRSEFDCGDPEMNLWLRDRAMTFQDSRVSYVHVLADPSSRILGFFTLSSFTVHLPRLDAATQRDYKEYRCNLPAILIGKLARDRSVRDRKVGEYLVEQALRKSLELANMGMGCVFVAVEASDKRIPWYQDLGFTRASSQSNLLYMPVADIEQQRRTELEHETCPAGIADQEKVVP